MRLASLVMAVVAACRSHLSRGAWTWPVGRPGAASLLARRRPYAGGQHRGMDIGADAGDAVRLPVAGRVSFAGRSPLRRTVTIRADGFAVTLLHLGDLRVARGAQVAEGQTVALSGRPASSSTRLPTSISASGTPTTSRATSIRCRSCRSGRTWCRTCRRPSCRMLVRSRSRCRRRPSPALRSRRPSRSLRPTRRRFRRSRSRCRPSR